MKSLNKDVISEKDKQERLARAKNKLKLMRRQITSTKNNRSRVLALVREMVRQRPDATAQIIQNWINNK